jgi:CDP-diacylglycerol--glycerol-3-phosphate 3-phosphatidyltransferase
MKHIPNILTGLRLAAGVLMFLFLAAAAGGVPFVSEQLTPESQFALERWALIAFVLACITDFFDGWLARKLHAESVWGAILDPIGDKILVCAAILGLAVQPGLGPAVALAGALMLFREFAVSALREVLGARRITLPVTLLAKWKTTLQLIALGGLVGVGALHNALPTNITQTLFTVFCGLLWIAAVVTVITGVQYAQQAAAALGNDPGET